jgi:hypothetical protein
MFIYLKNLILTHERCEQLNFYIQALKGIAVGYNVHGQVQRMETHLRNVLQESLPHDSGVTQELCKMQTVMDCVPFG